ncbi:proteasome activator complex subunit 3-like isoform X1 [Sycon ciliatum]|uniref:proteasome activator complex subunit 3-like isoform X1 n=1 Tax=Sycon ciliatum TaxID=27933 RepID=UPI0031F71ACC
MAGQPQTLDAFKQELFSEAEKLVRITFPEKVLELDALIKSDLFKIDNAEFSVDKTMASFGDLHEHSKATASLEPPAKRRCPSNDGNSHSGGADTLIPSNQLILGVIDRLKPEIHELMTKCNQVKMWIQLLIPRVEDGNNFGVSIQPPAKRRCPSNDGNSHSGGAATLIPSNQLILGVIDRLKPEIHELMTKCNQVKMWIQLLIPRVEDGNNFGVSIQEDAVGEVGRIEGEVVTYLDAISRYYLTRAKLVSKLLKYPSVDDYRRSVAEVDQKELLTLRLTCCEMRNAYCILHDTITKNIEKMKKPRSNNLDSLY